MLDRMHTQDLRAIVSAIVSHTVDRKVLVVATDNLLAEIDRTAPKAEPEPRGSWYEEAVKQQCRANALDRLTDEQNEAMKALEVELERIKSEWSRDQNNLAAALICLQSINRVHALALSNWVDYKAADGDYARINSFLDGQENVK